MRRSPAYLPAHDPTRDMLTAGIDITPDWRSNAAAKREKKGECPTCGMQTHKISMFGKKTALTIEGQVYKGTCLSCHPIEGYTRRPAERPHPGLQSRPLAPQPPPAYRGGGMLPQSQQPMSYPNQRVTSSSQLGLPVQSMERVARSATMGLPQHREPRRSQPPQFREPMPTQQLIHEQQQQLQQQQFQQQQLEQQHLEQQYHSEPHSGIRVPKALDVGGFNDDVSVITMDYDLTNAARHWNGEPGEIITQYSDGEEEVGGVPPIAPKRPGPDSGEGYGSRRDIYNSGPPPARSSFYRRNDHQLPPKFEHTSSWGALDHGSQGESQARPSQQVGPGYVSNDYPVAARNSGWDRNADLMPPGGMDNLFRNRAVENVPRPQSTVRQDSINEIRYEPRRNQSTEHVVLDKWSEPVPQHQPLAEASGPKRMLSSMSGPMYFPDDGPMYMNDEIDGPMYMDADMPTHTHPPWKTQYVVPLGGHDKLAHPTSGLLPRTSTGFSGPSHDTASQSTMGPPLKNPDKRGRPDEASIHDPAGLKRTTQQDDDRGPPTSIGSHQDRPPTIPTLQAEGGQTFTAKKAPSRYTPILSPILSVKEGSLKVTLPVGTTGVLGPRMMDDYDGVTPPVVTPPVPAGLKAPPLAVSNLKPPPPGSDYDRAPASNVWPRESTLPSPNHDVASTLRILSTVEKSGVHPAKAAGMTMEDITVLIHCLTVNQATIQMKAKALRILATIVWTAGPKAHNLVAKSKGVETLINTIWGDLGNVDLQDAAMEFLLSLAASSDGRPENDILSNEENVCDPLLFAMQTHSRMASIQLKGCTIFSCLAAASSNNPRVSDGSQALMMVLAAMSNHKNALDIQKAGLQALYYQCSLSRDAESNKRMLLESNLDNGASGLTVILNCMGSPVQDDLVAMEWACRLCWLLTSSEDLVKRMSGMPSMIEAVMRTCKRYIVDETSRTLLEACFGVIGNLAYIESSRVELVSSGAVGTLLEGMRYHRNDLSVHMEACSAFANLAQTTQLADAILAGGGLDSLLGAIQVDHEELVGEALRALVGLSVHSPEAKEAMTVPQVLKLIVATSSEYRESQSLQESCCKILVSLSINAGATDFLIEHGCLDYILGTLKSSTDENVLDAVCSLYRNLTCHVERTDRLLTRGALRSLIDCMSAHSNCVSLQTNVCSSIWNILCKSNKNAGDLVDQHVVEVIVKSMQNNLESSELLEAACGALWTIVDNNLDRKRELMACGAIDAVYCTLVMHEKTSTLIQACGVFSNISAEGPLAEAIASAQGVSAVSDAMQNNSSSIEFLEIACLTLRNIVCQFPQYAQEASMAISPIINAMRDNMAATSFHREASSLLWVLAAEAESCHSKILALDGPTVLIQSIDQNGHDQKCHEAGMGAFSHLVMSSNNL